MRSRRTTSYNPMKLKSCGRFVPRWIFPFRHWRFKLAPTNATQRAECSNQTQHGASRFGNHVEREVIDDVRLPTSQRITQASDERCASANRDGTYRCQRRKRVLLV